MFSFEKPKFYVQLEFLDFFVGIISYYTNYGLNTIVLRLLLSLMSYYSSLPFDIMYFLVVVSFHFINESLVFPFQKRKNAILLRKTSFIC